MAKRSRREKPQENKNLGKKIKNAAEICRSVGKAFEEIAYAYQKRQYKQYKKCAKFNKKTGFWKLKKIKRIKKAKFVKRKK